MTGSSAATGASSPPASLHEALARSYGPQRLPYSSTSAFAGLVFAPLAFAAFMRIAMVSSGASGASAIASLLPWLPPLAWGTAALLLRLFAVRNLPYLDALMQAPRG